MSYSWHKFFIWLEAGKNKYIILSDFAFEFAQCLSHHVRSELCSGEMICRISIFGALMYHWHDDFFYDDRKEERFQHLRVF